MKRNQGFTLLELLVVIVIVGIVTAIGVPSWRNQIEQQRLNSMTNTWQVDFRFAREQAISIRRPVLFCPVANEGDTTCLDDKTPARAWVICLKDATDDKCLDENKSILRQSNRYDRVSATFALIRFNSLGRIYSPDNSSGSATAADNTRKIQFAVDKRDSTTSKRCVDISAAGTLRVRDGSCS